MIIWNSFCAAVEETAGDVLRRFDRFALIRAQHADAFRGALGRETELGKAQTERLPVLRLVREIENFAILNLAAAAPRAQHGEVLAAPVGQLRRACTRAVAGNGGGALGKVSTAERVRIQAVFREHQGKAAIDDGLAREALAEVTNLRVAQLERDARARKSLFFPESERGGVVDVQRPAAVQLAIKSTRERQVAEVADRHARDAFFGGVLESARKIGSSCVR